MTDVRQGLFAPPKLIRLEAVAIVGTCPRFVSSTFCNLLQLLVEALALTGREGAGGALVGKGVRARRGSRQGLFAPPKSIRLEAVAIVGTCPRFVSSTFCNLLQWLVGALVIAGGGGIVDRVVGDVAGSQRWGEVWERGEKRREEREKHSALRLHAQGCWRASRRRLYF